MRTLLTTNSSVTLERARFPITGSYGVVKRTELTRQTPNLPFQTVNRSLPLMDSSKSTFEGAGHGQWRWPRTWPLNSRGLVCTAPEGAQSLPGSLSRVLLGCRHSSDLSIGPGKGRPAEGDSRMRGACRAHACAKARAFPQEQSFLHPPRPARVALRGPRGARGELCAGLDVPWRREVSMRLAAERICSVQRHTGRNGETERAPRGPSVLLANKK